MSALSSFSMEEIAEACPEGLLWFQLYILRDVDYTAALIRRAEAAGYHALCITVDNPATPTNERDEMSGLVGRVSRQPAGMSAPPPSQANMPQFANEEELVDALDPNITWETIDRIRDMTSLPIVIKGIQTREDAELCVAHGAQGLVVSNHGGHALSVAQATIEQLPEIAAAVGDRIEVFMDGGVRRGTDVLKALGLGARAVLIGRGTYWGLATGGENGVLTVLEMLRQEMHLAAIYCGISDVRRIDSSLVARP